VKWFTLAAEQGHVDAQYNLGQIHRLGKGVPKNDKTAVKWFTLAAEQGDAKAQFNLGVKYANGNGVPENDKIAVNWYTKAAEQGNDRAQYNLGNMYANGNGVPENDKIAVRWFTKAAEQGHVKAKFNLGLCRIMAMVFSQTIDVPMCGMKWPLILRNLSYGEDVSTDNSVTMTLPEAIDYVRQEVSNNWISPDNSREGTVTLEVKLSPTGRIIDVSVMSRDASDEFVDSVIEALRKVGSFEKLANLDRKLFDKNFRRFPLRFKPEDLR